MSKFNSKFNKSSDDFKKSIREAKGAIKSSGEKIVDSAMSKVKKSSESINDKIHRMGH